MNILVTDASYKHTLGIVRNLGIHGYRPYVASHQRYTASGLSRYCAGTLMLPRYDAPEFEAAFAAGLDRLRIDLVMPVGFKAFERLIAMRSVIEARCQMIAVGAEQLQLCLSKTATYRLAEQLGIPVPKTWRPESMQGLRQLALQGEVTYPCVIKSAKEMGTSVVAYAQDPTDLCTKFQEICDAYGFHTPDDLPIVQEYVQGAGCGFFAVYDHGQCGPTFQHLRLREMPPTGGYSVAAESMCNPQVLEYGQRLLSHLKWHGVAMVEFKLRPDGSLVLMEINPKFWGSTDLALEAGVDFPLELVRIAQGKRLFFSANYRQPLRYHWPLNGEVPHIIARPSAIAAVLRDITNPAVRSNLWLRKDPLPAALMLAEESASVARVALVRLRNGFSLRRS